eukprot:Clim_evm5s168 gene=Clim_evmTU5s168
MSWQRPKLASWDSLKEHRDQRLRMQLAKGGSAKQLVFKFQRSCEEAEMSFQQRDAENAYLRYFLALELFDKAKKMGLPADQKAGLTKDFIEALEKVEKLQAMLQQAYKLKENGLSIDGNAQQRRGSGGGLGGMSSAQPPPSASPASPTGTKREEPEDGTSDCYGETKLRKTQDSYKYMPIRHMAQLYFTGDNMLIIDVRDPENFKVVRIADKQKTPSNNQIVSNVNVPEQQVPITITPDQLIHLAQDAEGKQAFAGADFATVRTGFRYCVLCTSEAELDKFQNNMEGPVKTAFDTLYQNMPVRVLEVDVESFARRYQDLCVVPQVEEEADEDDLINPYEEAEEEEIDTEEVTSMVGDIGDKEAKEAAAAALAMQVSYPSLEGLSVADQEVPLSATEAGEGEQAMSSETAAGGAASVGAGAAAAAGAAAVQPAVDRAGKPTGILKAPVVDRGEKPRSGGIKFAPGTKETSEGGRGGYKPQHLQRRKRVNLDRIMPPMLPVRGQPPARGAVGLKNLGNTCYMNSIVQCLSHTSLLADFFISGTYHAFINQKNVLGTGGKLAKAFGNLVSALWLSQNVKSIAPVPFKNKVGLFAKQFAGYQQHDSQEFLSFLLDGLHEDMNQTYDRRYEEEPEYEKYSDVDAARMSWEFYRKRNKSLIVNLFQGQYRSVLACQTCGFRSRSFNPYMYLTCPLRRDGASAPRDMHLFDAMELLTTREIVRGDDMWFCPKCKKHRNAVKDLSIWSLPPILLVHLKRFGFDSHYRRKIETNVRFPMNDLSLSKFAQDPATRNRRYDLYAVSYHMGTLESGHYIAKAKHPITGQWHNFDDSVVKPIAPRYVEDSRAYVLFYVDKSVKVPKSFKRVQ